MSAILPWPARHERKAAIRAARAEKERSLTGAAVADTVRRQIEIMAEENHFASAIARQIIERHQGEAQ